jgi:Na+-driven multidrug efflux pump
MIISACCGVLNVFFNYIFLAVVPLGVAGAALGTVCASVLGAVAHVVIMLRNIPQSRIAISDMLPRASLMKELLNDGMAIALMNFVVNGGQVIIQRAINGFDPVVITGVSSGSKLVNLIWIIALALESALIYLCSQNDGAGKIDRVKKGIKASLIINTVACVGCVGIMLIFQEPLLRIFIGGGVDSDTLLTLEHASTYLVTQLSFLPAIILMSCFRGTVRGLGSSIPTVACGIIELVCRLVVMVICESSSFAENVKIIIIYLAGPAAWVGAVVLLAVVIPVILKRKQNKIFKEQGEQCS